MCKVISIGSVLLEVFRGFKMTPPTRKGIPSKGPVILGLPETQYKIWKF